MLRLRLLQLLPRLATFIIVPIVVYSLGRSLGLGQVASLALGGAMTVTWTGLVSLWRRRVDPIGAVSTAGFAVALLTSLLFGGNAFVLKLGDAWLTGAIGVVALVSVAVRRPLLSIVFRALHAPVKPARHRLTVMTAIIGATLVLDLLLRAALALTLPTTVFLAVHREVTWAILGLGVLLLVMTKGKPRQADDAAVSEARSDKITGASLGLKARRLARLQVEGASLHYAIRGSGPLLLVLQGGASDADGSRTLVDFLSSSFTVVTYDRRGQARSPLDEPGQRIDLETHSTDAHLLLAALADEPSYAFGSSIGAIIGLDLALRFPLQLRSLVAHEPPLRQLLPEARRGDTRLLQQAPQGDDDAIRAFAASIGIDRGGPAATQADSPSAGQNAAFFLEHDAPAVGRYRLDVAALKRTSVQVVVAAGAAGRRYFPYQCSLRLAGALGTGLVEFPGHHAGYLTEPRAFAAQLEEVLLGQSVEGAAPVNQGLKGERLICVKGRSTESALKRTMRRTSEL